MIDNVRRRVDDLPDSKLKQKAQKHQAKIDENPRGSTAPIRMRTARGSRK